MNTLKSQNQECFNRFCSCYGNLPGNEDALTFFYQALGIVDYTGQRLVILIRESP